MATTANRPQIPPAQEYFNVLADVLEAVGRQLTGEPATQLGIEQAMDIVENAIELLSGIPDLQNAEEILRKLNEAHEQLTVTANGFRCVTFHTDEHGRQSFRIPEQQLQYLIECSFTVPQIASLFCVSVRTIRRRMTKYGLKIRDQYTDITDEELKREIADFHSHFPTSGRRITEGYLMSKGIRVQRYRIMDGLREVNPLGVLVRGLRERIIPRREYKVPAPLSLWHIDGNHKLIRWRIVIHGGIDGFSRKIMFLKASTDNKASTVFSAFLGAVQKHGLPVRTRTDKGGENRDIARYMLEHPDRGPERRSHLTGKSVHNQRIERLWRDVFTLVSGNFYMAFRHLEEIGALDPDNEVDIICLHYVMVSRINTHLDLFTQTWDNHPLASERNKSPQQLWVSGLLTTLTQGTLPLEETEDPEERLGIADDEPVGSADQVTVPEPASTLKAVIEARLQDTVDPSQPSSCFGCDLYLRAKREVQTVIAPFN